MALTDSTISGIVSKGLNLNISHSNIHYKVGYVGADGIRRVYNMDSVIDKYRDILLQNMREIVLTDAEMEKYRFRPRSFCADLFNDKELWSTLLRLNNMLTCTDFNRKKIKVFGPKFTKTLNEILTLEDDYIIESVVEAKTV